MGKGKWSGKDREKREVSVMPHFRQFADVTNMSDKMEESIAHRSTASDYAVLFHGQTEIAITHADATIWLHNRKQIIGCRHEC